MNIDWSCEFHFIGTKSVSVAADGSDEVIADDVSVTRSYMVVLVGPRRAEGAQPREVGMRWRRTPRTNPKREALVLEEAWVQSGIER